MSRLDGEKTKLESESNTNEGASLDPLSSTPLVVGSIIILGSYLAGVIGFKYSRFAVGKDVHRGWQNYQRFSRQRARKESERKRMEAGEQRYERKAEEETWRQDWYEAMSWWEREIGGKGGEKFPFVEAVELNAGNGGRGTLYDELGVLPTATTLEIRRAYLCRAKALHPDTYWRKNVERVPRRSLEDSGAAFRRLHDAYRTLSDPVARQAYDHNLASGSSV